MTPSLSYRGTIAVLELGSDENRFSPDWREAVNPHLDAAQAEAQGLVTAGTGSAFRVLTTGTIRVGDEVTVAERPGS